MIKAAKRNARAESIVASTSLAKRLLRLIKAKKRSATQRLGSTAKPVCSVILVMYGPTRGACVP